MTLRRGRRRAPQTSVLRPFDYNRNKGSEMPSNYKGFFFPRFLMAALGSLPSLGANGHQSLLPRPYYNNCRLPSPPPRSSSPLLQFKISAETKQNKDTPSFAVATGELFLGFASRLLNSRKRGSISIPVELDSENLDVNGNAAYFTGEDDRLEVSSSVVEDPNVIWEQRLKDVEAERQRKTVTSPGFSFSAAGLLFPYHLGVAAFLLEKGYITENTPLAGSSAGAIVCAVIASGSSMQDALQATKLLADDCRCNGTAFRLGAVLREILVKFLPDDIHARSSGRIRVAVTQLFRRPRGLLVDQFDSKADLIDAVFTSSFIPGYLAPRPVTMFRNRLCIDGGLTLFMPPTSAAETVRVCAFPVGRLGLKGIGISPDCNPENRAGPRQLLKWALEPAEDDVLDEFYQLGYKDAAVWGEQNPVEAILKDDSIADS